MSGKSKDSHKMVLTFGILGFLAGIGLLFSDSKLIGVFGAIASAGLIIKSYTELKKLKNQEQDIEE